MEDLLSERIQVFQTIQTEFDALCAEYELELDMVNQSLRESCGEFVDHMRNILAASKMLQTQNFQSVEAKLTEMSTRVDQEQEIKRYLDTFKQRTAQLLTSLSAHLVSVERKV